MGDRLQKNNSLVFISYEEGCEKHETELHPQKKSNIPSDYKESIIYLFLQQLPILINKAFENGIFSLPQSVNQPYPSRERAHELYSISYNQSVC